MPTASDFSYTLISCHYGDPFWITHTLRQVDALSDHRVVRAVIVDQSRQSDALLRDLPRVEEVLTFPPDEEQIRLIGHDHPSSLNRALRSVNFDTSHVMVLDSDCFPRHADWLDKLSNVTMAADPAKWFLSHPCFMTFPVGLATQVDFCEGLVEIGADAGRFVGLQVAHLGQVVSFAPPGPRRAFAGRRGHYYLDGAAYHHGSASFASADDHRLREQIDPPTERRYRRAVELGRTEPSRADSVSFFADRVRRVLRRRMGSQ